MSDKVIVLDKFQPRHYQKRVLDALFNKDYKRILLLWPRRAGKDILCLNILIRAALLKPAVYFYVFPEYSQARRVLWKSLTSDGQPFLSYFPEEIVAKINQQEMSITLKNDAIIQILGSNKFDSHRGTNPSGIIYSEYAYQDPQAHMSLSPALRYNDGFAIFITTVRGKNHAYDMYNIAQNFPETWYSEKLTINDTGHISSKEVEAEIERGEISWDLAQSEYYSNFDIGIEGSFYAKIVDKMRLNNQITDVPYESAFKVRTAWDIGNDCTAIIFYFIDGNNIKIIDYYENSGPGYGLEHYAKIVLDKPYVYATNGHLFPHDMVNTEWGSVQVKGTRLEKAKTLGLLGTICDKLPVDDGIEAVKSTLTRIWIDRNRCKRLIKALENYRQVWDSKLNKYSGKPLHDEFSHACDSMRYLCVNLRKLKDGNTTPQELDQRYRQAMGISTGNGFFDSKF